MVWIDTGANSSPLALVKSKGSGVVISRHGDHRVPVEGAAAGLVHCVASNGGGGVAGPVESVPTPVICQALH